MDSFASARHFRVWDFHVSHSHLLIRSARNEDDSSSENLDLIFKGVFYLEIADMFNGLELAHPTDTELHHLETRCGVIQTDTERFYALISNNRRYYIGAIALTVDRNTLPWNESNSHWYN